MVNHSYSFVDRHTGAHTNTIEGIWSHCKKDLKRFNGIKKCDLNDNIHAWCFRWNYCSRNNTKDHFQIIGEAIAHYW